MINLTSRFLFLILLFSCNDSEEPVGTISNLIGKWRTSCVVIDVEGDEFGFISDIEFSENIISTLEVVYENTDCSLSPLVSYFYEGDSSLNETSKMINYQITSYEVTPENEDLVENWNNETFCGLTDWSLGVGEDAFNCDDFITEEDKEADLFNYSLSENGQILTITNEKDLTQNIYNKVE